MNPTIIAVIASVAAFIISLFAIDHLNQRFLERIFDQRTKTPNANPDQHAKMSIFRAEINTLRVEITNLAQRVERIERQLDKIFKPILPGS